MRKPSIKKSIKARTTGKIKRKIKKTIIPAYDEKGTGIFKDPKKAIYNKIYNKTTFGVKDVVTAFEKTTKNNYDETALPTNNEIIVNVPPAIEKPMNNKMVFSVIFIISTIIVYTILKSELTFDFINMVSFIIVDLIFTLIAFAVVKFIYTIKHTQPLL